MNYSNSSNSCSEVELSNNSGEFDNARVRLALGRILRLLSRPYQNGDVRQYEDARAVVLAHRSELPMPYKYNFVRDRLGISHPDAS